MKRFYLAAHAVFVLVGIATTMLGPLLPLLAQRWHLNDRQSGVLFLAQFIGGFLGAIISTRLARGLSLHVITRLGLLLTAAGVLGLATPLRLVATAGIALYGVGIGLCTPSITAAVSEAAEGNRASLLNFLNFAWAVGAITAPNMVLPALQRTGIALPRMLEIFAVILVGAAFLIPRIAASAAAEEASDTPMHPHTLRLIVACGVLIFIYVGIENGVAGWLPTFATRVHQFDPRYRALLQDTFWLTFLLGRFCAPALLKVVGEKRLVTLSIVGAVAGTMALLLVKAPAATFASVAAVGAGCAAVFPTAIAILSHRLSGQSGSKLGFMFAAAGLGSAVLPFSIGMLSTVSHSLRVGMSLLLVAEFSLLAAHFYMSHIVSREELVASEPSSRRAIA